MFKRGPTTTTTRLGPSTSLSSHPNNDLSRSQSTVSTAVPPSLFSNDGASILTELPTYADVYANGRIPCIGLATNFAFPRATNMSMVQDWGKSNVDYDLFFHATTNMILRLEGKVYTLRHQVEIINPATRLPILHLRQDIPALGLDFKLFAPLATSPHDIDESSPPLATIIVRSGGLRGKPFRDTLELTFTNTAAQPVQNGTSTAKDKTITLLTELNGFKDMSGDVVRVDEETGREIVVGRIVRQLVNAEERIDVQAAAGVDVRLLVVLALCMKYRRRNA